MASRTVWKVGKWDNNKVNCDRLRNSFLSSAASTRCASLVTPQQSFAHVFPVTVVWVHMSLSDESWRGC